MSTIERTAIYVYTYIAHTWFIFVCTVSMTPRGCTDKNGQGMCNVVEREIEEIILAPLILALLDNLSNCLIYTLEKLCRCT